MGGNFDFDLHRRSEIAIWRSRLLSQTPGRLMVAIKHPYPFLSRQPSSIDRSIELLICSCPSAHRRGAQYNNQAAVLLDMVVVR
jgi:hypothetical protein